jgi:beta-catenin-like protein 1
LARFDEEVEEERAGIEQGLTLVENCLDLDQAGALRLAHDGVDSRNETEYQSIVRRMLQSTTLLTYLLQRASNSSSDTSIRLHASELLSSLLQHDDARLHAADISQLPPFRSAFDDDINTDGGNSGTMIKKKEPSSVDAAAKVDGMECLLQSIAPYRKRDPETAEEVEILENLYDALAACLQNAANAQAFVDGQGVELMLRCIRSGGHGGYGACKILHFACSGPSLPTEGETAYKSACETLVEAGGLKQIFPLFMGRSSAVPNPAPCSDAGRGLAAARKKAENDDNDHKQKKRKKKAAVARKEWLREVEGNSIRILYELTRHLDDSSPNESKNRLLAKFLENDCVSADLIYSLIDIFLFLRVDEKMDK